MARPLLAALLEADLAVAVVNPRQVQQFAGATGQPAKTDTIDAKVLAQFGEAIQPVGQPANEPCNKVRAAPTIRGA